ncbi:MAG: 4-hydroxythreonine-4-phosphate dehydrogenase PdxA, partial [Candidatus Alcyoniella australis]|nr:4-hydroxythreonine-4-phosphate dehydrogenase PdxA [Candidatus Alcyoniella australis]
MRPVRLAVSLGDPAGVGPELLAALAGRDAGLPDNIYLTVFGDRGALERGCVAAGVDPTLIRELPADGLSEPTPGKLDLVQVGDALGPVKLGAVDADCGAASFEWFSAAVEAVVARSADAVVTGPICKQSWAEAGVQYAGHTGWLAQRFGLPTVMMLAGPRLRVVPLTVHVPLARVPQLLTRELVLEQLRILQRALIEDFGVKRPRIALAGLNPHAGEGGGIGREELEVLIPAAQTLRAEGIDISDPLPADGLFPAAIDGGYDAVACPTHDQALIPFKLLQMHSGVNLTLGLPIVRTSPA